jgi:hypothetical protein
MKTFKSFLNEQESQKLPSMMAVYGSHSQPKQKENQSQPSMQTVYGSHSQPKSDTFHADPIISNTLHKEEAGPTQGIDQIKLHTSKIANEIHNKNKVNDYDNSVWHYAEYSEMMNHALHVHYKNNDHPANFNEDEHIRDIDKVLNKHKISHDTHVFSGLKESPEKHFAKQKTRNQTVQVHFPAYTSTTTNFDLSTKFADNKSVPNNDKHPPLNKDSVKSNDGETKHIIKLHVPKGTPGGSIRHISPHDDEDEVMLHRGLNVEIHHQPTMINHPKHGHLTVWHARVIGHNPKKIK